MSPKRNAEAISGPRERCESDVGTHRVVNKAAGMAGSPPGPAKSLGLTGFPTVSIRPRSPKEGFEFPKPGRRSGAGQNAMRFRHGLAMRVDRQRHPGWAQGQPFEYQDQAP